MVMAWGDPRRLYDLKSTTKSFGSIALGLAIKDGKLRLEDKAKRHHPTLGVPPEENARTGWLDEMTILHLASQTAGFEKPGGYTKLLFRPGTQWDYSDSGPNWLAECITLAYHRDLDEWMFERAFTPLGIQHSDLTWRKNSYRPATIAGVARREFGAGIHASVDAMARIGYLMLREGQWNGREILTREYAKLAPRTPPGHEKLPVRLPETYSNAAPHYGLLWWNNTDQTLPDAPTDAFWSWGLYDSLIVVVPSLDIVVARAGESWKREKGTEHYAVLRPFLAPIVQSVQLRSALHPLSPVIREVLWAPPETILRRAKGSDNWPMTWADDDWLYTVFQQLDSQGRPVWTKDIARCGAVWTSPGRCYRSSVCYNAGLRRYLWIQTGLGEDTRFAGGLAIYDAPEPWGPWTTALATDAWDVGPGETASFPTKWISSDGCTLHLVFSGEDCFSVRQATLKLHQHSP
jgi:hypothetical protein